MHYLYIVQAVGTCGATAWAEWTRRGKGKKGGDDMKTFKQSSLNSDPICVFQLKGEVSDLVTTACL